MWTDCLSLRDFSSLKEKVCVAHLEQLHWEDQMESIRKSHKDFIFENSPQMGSDYSL